MRLTKYPYDLLVYTHSSFGALDPVKINYLPPATPGAWYAIWLKVADGNTDWGAVEEVNFADCSLSYAPGYGVYPNPNDGSFTLTREICTLK